MLRDMNSYRGNSRQSSQHRYFRSSVLGFHLRESHSWEFDPVVYRRVHRRHLLVGRHNCLILSQYMYVLTPMYLFKT